MFEQSSFHRNAHKLVDKMDITTYRLTSMEEPTDAMLHELMRQVAESARQSSANANKVLETKMQETIAQIKRERQLRQNIQLKSK